MIYVSYEEAVAAMTKGLSRYLPEEKAHHFAEIFAGNLEFSWFASQYKTCIQA